MIDFNPKVTADFEVVLQTRDQKGNPTGKTVSFCSNDGNKICDFYEKHQAMMNVIQNKRRKKRKKRNNKKEG